MTYRVLTDWVDEVVLLGMPLHERIKYVRTNLATDREGSRKPWLSQGDFAEAVGASDRAIALRWERKTGGSTPRVFAAKIAALTPYPPEAFGADGEAELVRRSLGTRLESLEKTAVRTEDLAPALNALRLLATGKRAEALRVLSEAGVQ